MDNIVAEELKQGNILDPSYAKRIATQILVIAKLNGRKDFILRVFVCDIIHPSKK